MKKLSHLKKKQTKNKQKKQRSPSFSKNQIHLHCQHTYKSKVVLLNKAFSDATLMSSVRHTTQKMITAIGGSGCSFKHPAGLSKKAYIAV